MKTSRFISCFSAMSALVCSANAVASELNEPTKGAALLASMNHKDSTVRHEVLMAGLPIIPSELQDCGMVLEPKQGSKGAEWIKSQGHPMRLRRDPQYTNYHSKLTSVGTGKTRRLVVEIEGNVLADAQ